MGDSQYSRLWADTQSFLSKRYGLFRVRLLEKVSRIFGLIVSVLVVLFLSSIVVIFGGIALAYVLGQWMPMWAAFLIMMCVFVVLIVMAVVFRKQLFINPLVGVLGTILFASDDANAPADTNKDTSTIERKEAEND